MFEGVGGVYGSWMTSLDVVLAKARGTSVETWAKVVEKVEYITQVAQAR